MSQTPVSTHTFFIASCILHDSLLRGQEVELTSKDVSGKVLKVFQNKSLNKYLTQVYSDIDRALRRSDLNPELKRILPSGMTLLNIFDVGVNKGVHDFLCLIACYARRMFSLAVLSLDNDLPSLKYPPNLAHDRYKGTPNVNMMRESRLFYLARFAALTQLATGNADSVVFIATHNGTKTDDELSTALDKLKSELQQEAQRQGIPVDLDSKVQLLNSENTEEIKQFRKSLENAVISMAATLNIKLSWIFLRTFLYSEEKMFVEIHEIEKLASELCIEGEDFKEFLTTFTDFGSILYIPDVPTLNRFAVLQPTQFVNLIGKLFYPPQHCNPSTYNGLLNLSKVADIVDQGAVDIIVHTLCDLGLGVLIDKGRVADDQAESLKRSNSTGSDHDASLPTLKRQDSTQASEAAYYLYIPLARTTALVESPNVDSLLLTYESQLIPPHMPAIFVKHFVKLPDVLLVPIVHNNVVQFRFPSKNTVMLVFHDRFIEIQVEQLKEDMCKRVITCCEDAMQAIAKFIKKLGYKFRLRCLKPTVHQHDGSEDPHKKDIQLELGLYEELPNKYLCHACEAHATRSPVRALWKTTINKVWIHYS